MAVEDLEEVASLDEEVHSASDHQGVAAYQDEVELAFQVWEEEVGHASWEEVASQDAGHIEEASGNAQEELNQVSTQGDTGLGEGPDEVGLLVAHLEVGILASADQADGSQEHLGNSSQEPIAEGLELEVGRSEAASCPELDHQRHELDQTNQVGHEQEVQLEYLVQRLDQDLDQPWQQPPWTWRATLQEGEDLQPSWK